METKKEYKFFTIFEHEKEQEYLRDQHRAGWKFTKVTGFGMYHFERCKPEEVVYQLDYNKEGSANKEEYIKMYSDCGWEYMQEFFGYSYFRKSVEDMDGEEEIFCDDESRLAMMERVYKARLVPLLIIFIMCLLPTFILNIAHGRYLIAMCSGGVLAVYAALFMQFARQYSAYKNKGK